MGFIKNIKDFNRKRLSKRKKARLQLIDPRLMTLMQEAREELSRLDPAAHGNYPDEIFFVRPRGEFAPPHPAVDDFARLMVECGEAKILLFAPWISRGGADKVTINFFKVAQNKYGAGAVKLILTELDPIKTDLPKEVLDNVVILSKKNKQLPYEVLIDLITRLVHFISPDYCININSKAFWDALSVNGAILSRNRKILVAAFCTEVLQDGRESGYVYSHLRDCAQHVTHIISDNYSFKERLRSLGVLSESAYHKWHVIRQPAEFDFSLPIASRLNINYGGRGGARILWASRICYQKNWDVLIEIARRNPDIHFDIWGEGPDAEKVRAASVAIKNILYKGSFVSIVKVVNEGGYDAFLYTSRMDGIPNILLEVGALGLPMVSSYVGAIPDILSEEKAFVVLDHTDVNSYSEALRALLSDKNAAKDRAIRLLEFIKKHHNISQSEKAILEVI